MGCLKMVQWEEMQQILESISPKGYHYQRFLGTDLPTILNTQGAKEAIIRQRFLPIASIQSVTIWKDVPGVFEIPTPDFYEYPIVAPYFLPGSH